jgi:hypothetical protein
VRGDYLWDRSGPPDFEVARLERLLAQFKQQQPPRMLPLAPPRRSNRGRWVFALTLTAAAASVLLLVGLTWLIRFQSVPGLPVTRLAGTPTIGSRPVADRRQLSVGHWLETDQQARASIDVGEIGRVEIEPRTRLGLLSTRPGDYRLQLARGTMHALIWAPPGQFFVETPSSTAVDLGCSYTMTVDDDGVGLIRVTSGWVGFSWRGREAFIPAGAVCVTRPGLGPGTPHYEDTSDAFRESLTTLDLHAGSPGARTAALDRVLAEVREKDVVTLWHLLVRVDVSDRDRVFDRLAQFVAPPDGVSRDGIRAGRHDMLDKWWDKLGLGTTNWWRVWEQQWKDNGAVR